MWLTLQEPLTLHSTFVVHGFVELPTDCRVAGDMWFLAVRAFWHTCLATDAPKLWTNLYVLDVDYPCSYNLEHRTDSIFEENLVSHAAQLPKEHHHEMLDIMASCEGWALIPEL